jgi:hypothetical protein
MTSCRKTCEKARRAKPSSARAHPPRECPRCGTTLEFGYAHQTQQAYYVCPNPECSHLAPAIRQRNGIRTE